MNTVTEQQEKKRIEHVIEHIIERMTDDMFSELVIDFHLETGDIHPSQSYKLEQIKQELKRLSIEFVNQNK